MNTPKTCEEYVLNRIMELEGKIKTKEGTIGLYGHWLRDAWSFRDMLKRHMKVEKRDGGRSVISIDTIFEQYNNEDFKKFVEFFQLEEFLPEEGAEEEKVAEE